MRLILDAAPGELPARLGDLVKALARSQGVSVSQLLRALLEEQGTILSKAAVRPGGSDRFPGPARQVDLLVDWYQKTVVPSMTEKILEVLHAGSAGKPGRA